MPEYVKAQPGDLGDLVKAAEAIVRYVRLFLIHVFDRGKTAFPGRLANVFPEVRRYVEKMK